MTILCIGGQKGGVGKTTLSIQFAGLLALSKRRVLVVDTDSEPSVLMWLGERPKHLPLIVGAFYPQRVPARDELVRGYDDVVIDAGAGDTEVLRSALEIADLFVSPFRASQLDVWKAAGVVRRLTTARKRNPALRAVAVVNCVSPFRPRPGPAAHAALSQFAEWSVAATMVRELGGFEESSGNGHAVHEMDRATAAAEEMWRLWSELEVAA